VLLAALAINLFVPVTFLGTARLGLFVNLLHLVRLVVAYGLAVVRLRLST
jgi:hypothetical protein